MAAIIFPTDPDRLNYVSTPWVDSNGKSWTYEAAKNRWNPYLSAGGGGGGSTDVAAATHAATSKTTPVDADELPLVDSASDPAFGLKKLTWGNLRAGITAAAFSDMSAGDYGNLLKTDGFGSIVINTVTGNALLLKANGAFTAGFRTDTVDNPLSASRYYEAPNADGVVALTSSLTGIPDAVHNGTLTGTTWTFGTGAAAALLTAAGGGATGQSVFQAATVAAAREALGGYLFVLPSNYTNTTSSFTSVGVSVSLTAGTWEIDFLAAYENVSASSCALRMAAGTKANVSNLNGACLGIAFRYTSAIAQLWDATNGIIDFGTRTDAFGTMQGRFVIILTGSSTLYLEARDPANVGTLTIRGGMCYIRATRIQ